jgi:hypothetical protein
LIRRNRIQVAETKTIAIADYSSRNLRLCFFTGPPTTVLPYPHCLPDGGAASATGGVSVASKELFFAFTFDNIIFTFCLKVTGVHWPSFKILFIYHMGTASGRLLACLIHHQMLCHVAAWLSAMPSPACFQNGTACLQRAAYLLYACLIAACLPLHCHHCTCHRHHLLPVLVIYFSLHLKIFPLLFQSVHLKYVIFLCCWLSLCCIINFYRLPCPPP